MLATSRWLCPHHSSAALLDVRQWLKNCLREVYTQLDLATARCRQVAGQKFCASDFVPKVYFGRRGPCKHAEGCSHRVRLTKACMMAAAAEIRALGIMHCMEGASSECGLYECKPLAYGGEDTPLRFYTNVVDQTCSCHAFLLFGVCCHLLVTLSSEDGEALLEAKFSLVDEEYLDVKRPRRHQALPRDLEPLGDDIEHELSTLDASVYEKTCIVAVDNLSNDKAACMALLGGIGKKVKAMEEPAASILRSRLERLLMEADQGVPAFQDTDKVMKAKENRHAKRSCGGALAAADEKEKRLPKEGRHELRLTHKPLFPNRTGKKGCMEDSGEDREEFADVSRKKSKKSGLGNMAVRRG